MIKAAIAFSVGAVFSISAIANDFTAVTANPATDKSLGAVPTFYLSLPFEDVLKMVQQDDKEGRSIGSKSKPSLLSMYVNGVKNVPGVADGSSSGNSFSANSGFVCVTLLSVTVPKRGGNFIDSASASGTLVSAQKFCSNNAPVTPGQFGNFRRDSAYNSGQLQGLYNNYLSTNFCSYNNSTVQQSGCDNWPRNKTQIFTDKATIADNYAVDEHWGLSFFDKSGGDGLLQEMVIVTAHWQ